MPYLARRFTVIAPDLLGHGESAKPKGDYSLGAYASGLRDLLVALGHDRATFVGHSLGGGIAMQLAYQFPERCERLVLVDSGGLGRDVSVLLRSATLPGVGARAARCWRRRGCSTSVARRAACSAAGSARGHRHRGDRPRSRDARRSRIPWRLRPYAARHRRAGRPARRRLRPAVSGGSHPLPADLGRARLDHSRRARATEPTSRCAGSRLEVFANSGHFPQLDEPERFLDVLIDFMDSTDPAQVDHAALARAAARGSRSGRLSTMRARWQTERIAGIGLAARRCPSLAHL